MAVICVLLFFPAVGAAGCNDIKRCMQGKWCWLTRDGISRSAMTSSCALLPSGSCLYQLSSYQFLGKNLVAFEATGCFRFVPLRNSLLPWVSWKVSPCITLRQSSMTWKTSVRAGFIQLTGTETSCFSLPVDSPSVSSPLIPSTPTASSAARLSLKPGFVLKYSQASFLCKTF